MHPLQPFPKAHQAHHCSGKPEGMLEVQASIFCAKTHLLFLNPLLEYALTQALIWVSMPMLWVFFYSKQKYNGQVGLLRALGLEEQGRTWNGYSAFQKWMWGSCWTGARPCGKECPSLPALNQCESHTCVSLIRGPKEVIIPFCLALLRPLWTLCPGLCSIVWER